jgi:hydroxyethylthiazole kinase-like uncharacterized protein yjeF
MRPVLTALQMREMDRETITQVGIPGAVLMETAGRAVVLAVLDLLGKTPPASAKVVVVCGSGNNGGDGFVVARVLAERGIHCEVFLVMDSKGVTGDAKIYHDAFLQCGGAIAALQTSRQLEAATKTFEDCDVIVDAIFGTGLCRDISGTIAKVVDTMNSSAAAVVAVDLPSGLHADTGAVLGVAVHADATVTMGAAKMANAGAPGFSFGGQLRVAEIGIPGSRLRRVAQTFVVESSDVRHLIPVAGQNAHKVEKGHVLALAGSSGKRGAGRLAGMAALRTGAGLVTLGAASPDQQAEDPLMSWAVSSCSELESAWEGKHALLMGPGMQTDAQAKSLVMHALSHSTIPMVLDADALNHLAGKPKAAKAVQAPLVLTPHPGEAGRLLGLSSVAVQADRLAAVKKLAKLTQAVVVLKGARTCIADGRTGGTPFVLLCEQGGPELATAGTGDVLAGMIAALLAQGLDPAQAAMLGVYWHGVAGRTALHRLGGAGVVASDVVSAIPHARTEIAASE